MYIILLKCQNFLTTITSFTKFNKLSSQIYSNIPTIQTTSLSSQITLNPLPQIFFPIQTHPKCEIRGNNFIACWLGFLDLFCWGVVNFVEC